MFSKTSFVLFAALSLFSDLTVAQTCRKQSCQIADASGSTGHSIDGKIIVGLKDVTPDGRRCIEQAYVTLNLPVPPNYTPLTQLPAGYTGRTDWWTTRKMRRAMEKEFSYKKARELDVGTETEEVIEEVAEAEDVEKRQTTACKPKTLIWARGTIDPPVDDNIGVILGPNMKSGLEQKQPGQWLTHGVEYTADFAGDYCIGMPGGIACKKLIEQVGDQCPDTKFVVAGYSQGAMIAHNCVAFAKDSIRDRVAAVVVFGDPFNGAPIRKFPSSNIKTFCDGSDGVCGGSLDIGLGHFSYSLGDAVTQAINWVVTKI